MSAEVVTGVLQIRAGQVAARCVVVGDPARAKALSLLLDDPVRVW